MTISYRHRPVKWHRVSADLPCPTWLTVSSVVCLEWILVMASFHSCLLFLSSTFLGTLRKWEVFLVYIPITLSIISYVFGDWLGHE